MTKRARARQSFVVLCRSAEDAAQALATVRAWGKDNWLTPHPERTHIGDCRVAGEGFEFLGYRFEAGRRWVRRESLNAFRERVRRQTRRSIGKSLSQVTAKLNPMLRGWYGYFKHADKFTFRSMDGFVRRRLRAILRKQSKRPGMGHCDADHKRWPNAYFSALGLFTINEAHALESQS